jgi:GrpB-like predicted nucleotidyltransferase (UPF0157 family)
LGATAFVDSSFLASGYDVRRRFCNRSRNKEGTIILEQGSEVKKSLEQRIEEAVREEISIVPYDPRWPDSFQTEVNFLLARLPRGLIGRIEHFGSTAVPGLAAKPIVDMLIEVTTLEDARSVIAPILEAEGYDYFWRTDVSPPYAWFIKRDSAGNRTHHLHMVESDSELWNRLSFRDYLREFPEEAQAYAALKYSLAAKYPNDRISYTQAKTEFIQAVTETAREYFESIHRTK